MLKNAFVTLHFSQPLHLRTCQTEVSAYLVTSSGCSSFLADNWNCAKKIGSILCDITDAWLRLMQWIHLYLRYCLNPHIRDESDAWKKIAREKRVSAMIQDQNKMSNLLIICLSLILTLFQKVLLLLSADIRQFSVWPWLTDNWTNETHIGSPRTTPGWCTLLQKDSDKNGLDTPWHTLMHIYGWDVAQCLIASCLSSSGCSMQIRLWLFKIEPIIISCCRHDR